MKTAEEMIEYLKAELAEAKKSHREQENWDSAEAAKCQSRVQELERLLTELAPEALMEDAETAGQKRSAAEQMNRVKNRIFGIILNLFAFFVCITSWLFVDELIYGVVEANAMGDGVSRVLHYGYLFIHIIAFTGIVTGKYRTDSGKQSKSDR